MTTKVTPKIPEFFLHTGRCLLKSQFSGETPSQQHRVNADLSGFWHGRIITNKRTVSSYRMIARAGLQCATDVIDPGAQNMWMMTKQFGDNSTILPGRPSRVNGLPEFLGCPPF